MSRPHPWPLPAGPRWLLSLSAVVSHPQGVGRLLWGSGTVEIPEM